MDQDDIDDGLAPHEMVNDLGDDLSSMSVNGLNVENVGKEKTGMDGDIGNGIEVHETEHESAKRPADLPLKSTTSSTSSFDTTPTLMSTTPGRFVSLWLSGETKDNEKTPVVSSQSSSLPIRPLHRSQDRSPSKKKDAVVLLNHLDGSEYTDTLHSQAVQVHLQLMKNDKLLNEIC